MAKSGQKKAFVEETVQNDLPEKELTLSHRPDFDLSSSIQAEAYRTGAFPNSSFWNDLSKISQDIHATRRNGALMDANVKLKEREYENKFDAMKYEQVSKSNNDIILAKRKMEFQAELQDLIERTKREGGSVSQAVGAFRESYLNNFENSMRLSGEFSPYAYDSLYSYVDRNTESALANAITWDYETLEVQNKAVMDTAASTALTYLYKGVDAGGNPFLSVEDGMSYLGGVIGPNLKYIKESDEEELANNYYNNLVLMRAHKEKDIFEADPINYPGGYQGFINNIQGLAAQYGEKRMWEFQTGEEDTDGVKSFAVALTPQTLTALSNMTAKTGGADKAVSKALAAASEFDKYIDYKALSSGKYTESEFLKRNSVDSLQSLTMNTLNPLIQLAAQGNEKAITELDKICPHYVEARTPLFILDTIRQGRAEGRDLASIVTDLRSRFATAQRLAKDYSNPAGAGIMEELIFNGSNGQTINMNLPEVGKDLLLDAYFDRKGGDVETSRRNYVASTAEAGLNFLDKCSMSDLLLMVNSDFSDGLSDVESFTRIENITRYDQGDERLVPDKSRLQEVVGMLNHLSNVQEANTKGFKATTLTTEFIKSKAKELAELPLDTQIAACEFLGMAFVEAGLTSTFKEADLVSLNSNEQNVARNIAMWMHLHKDPAIYESYGNRIKAYLKDNPGVSINIDAANKATEGLISGARGINKNLEDTINAYFGNNKDGYNVPAEDRSYLRNTMMLMAVAATSVVDKNGKRKPFNASDYDILLSSIYTKNGTALDSKVFANNNITPEGADNIKANTDKKVQKAFKALKISDDDISVRVNSDTGKLDIIIAGQPAVMPGEVGEGELAGTGSIPMSYSLVNKPSNMPQGKYEQSIAIEAASGLILLPLANATSNKQAMEYVQMRAGKTNINNVKNDAIRMFAVAQRKSVQDRWINLRNNNYSGYIYSAQVPAELMKVLDAIYDGADAHSLEGTSFAYGPGDVPDVASAIPKALSKIDAWVTDNNIPGLRLISKLTGGYERQAERMSDVMSKDEFHHYVNFLWNESYSNDKPSTGTNTTLLYSAAPPNFKAKPNEQRNLTYFADVIVPDIRKRTGVSNLTVTSRYRAGDPQYHGKGQACDLATDNLSRSDANKVMAEVLKVPNIQKIGTSDPEFLRVYGHDKSSTNYNPMVQDLTAYDKAHGTNHKNHMHITIKPDSVTDKNGDFVKAASATIQQNVNGKVGYIDNRTSTFLPQALPNYKPQPWVLSRMGVSQSDINKNSMLRMTALGTEYCWMKSAFGAGHEDLAIAAVAGAKFKIIPLGKINKTIKVPTESVTGEKVLKLIQSGVLANDYSFTIDTKDPHYPYVQNVLRSASKSMIIGNYSR